MTEEISTFENLYNAAMVTLKLKDVELGELHKKVDALGNDLTSIRIDHQRSMENSKVATDGLKLKEAEVSELKNDLANKKNEAVRMRLEHTKEMTKLKGANMISKQRSTLMETDMKILRTEIKKANVDLVTERSRRIQPELKKVRENLSDNDTNRIIGDLRRENVTIRSRLDEQAAAIKRSNIFIQTLQAKLNDSGTALQNMVNEKYPDRLRDNAMTIKVLRDRVGTLEVEAKKDGIEIAKLRQKIKTTGA